VGDLNMAAGKPHAGLLPLLYTLADLCDMSQECRDWVRHTQLEALPRLF
jgi:hypothetical protein